MRNRSLHLRLREFAEEAAFQLSADAEQVDDLPFEVVESPGARTPLYCYRPLTAQFIGERVASLSRLPTYGRALGALNGLAGLDDYLRLRGEPRVAGDAPRRARATLSAFLTAIHDGRTDFEFSAPRFDAAYRELEGAVYERRSLTAVIVPVHGLALVSEEVSLDGELTLVRGDCLEGAPREAVWWGARAAEEPNVLAQVTLTDSGGTETAVQLARRRFAGLLTALRLADGAAFALGALGWARADAGAWQPIPFAGGGSGASASAEAEAYLVMPEEEDELRGFCNLVARRVQSPPAAEVAWALTRFEAGCARDQPLQALTDHLLALRALLEPEGPGSGRMAQRLGAICALPEDRPALAERIAHAISLERAVVAGLPPADPEGAGTLVEDVSHHLRSLLRDVLCGHLEPALVALADELAAEAVTGESPALVPAGAPG
jgi:hypothetical protein